VGLATQNPLRQRRLIVDEKFRHVTNFHWHTMASFRDLTAAAGVISPQHILTEDFYRPGADGDPLRLQIDLQLEDSELLSGIVSPLWSGAWSLAEPNTFRSKR
jgi:hypothetical protein